MKITKYPDGASYVSEVTTTPITFKINSYEDLWHLNQYVDAFNSKFGFNPNVVIPCLLDAQADRRFAEDQSFGLKLVCNFLNSMKVKMFYIFHPHNPELVEGLLDNVRVIKNTDFIKSVLEDIEKDSKDNWDINGDLTLMSSDAGGFKPLMKLCDAIEWKGDTYSAPKSRSWDEEEGTKFVQQIDRLDFKGRDVLIVDDLSVYGGTFKGLSKLLRNKNVGKLYLAVSHMTVQELGDDPVTNYFDKVYTTNSKFTKYLSPQINSIGGTYLGQPKNLEIIKLFDFNE